ncbi:hypothetical protein DXG03_008619 [Asterophora parasitica]|uniref:Flavin reductase like domain-containing protein n=1 Tax=Asterophora parasitica TaxID=117018 RepID=A0A9P7G706_9AGAR|nr:hypothetical protein DXG03_008619 [Asterophora parasitica]
MASNSSQPGFKIVDPPNPSWTYGQKVDATPEGREWLEGEKAGWTTVNASAPEDAKKLFLLFSGIVPRPIAFVSTISENGIANIAPFSWFNQVSSSPPVISVSITRNADSRPKDTLRNILATKGFTVNIISEAWIAQANAASIDAPEDVSEWPLSGLTQEPSIYVKAPRVKESAFSLELELLETVDVRDPVSSKVTTTLVLGSVKYIHVRNDVLDARGSVDPGKLRTVAKLGGILFAKVNEGYNIPRYSWAEHGKQIQELESTQAKA